MRIPALMLAALALFLTSAVFAEGVYRWEQNGKVFYSDQPPPKANAEEINPGVPGRAAPATDNPAQEQEAERQAVRSRECDKARARLVEYQNSPVLKQRNLKGEERELTASERIDVIVRAQADVNELCGETGADAGFTADDTLDVDDEVNDTADEQAG